jgi:HK97 family phage prohead protease
MEPDFGGYATKAGLRCSDGRVIKAEAFQHMDGKKVPLVYQHGHSGLENVLGHMVLEARDDGMYGRGYFNETQNGQIAKAAVQHGDLDSLSIWANGLKEVNKIVSHGKIREVSLVLSGANPGAKIDYVRIQHGDDPDDTTELADEAIIHTGETLELPQEKVSDKPLVEDKKDSVVDNKAEETEVQHADNQDGSTVQDIYDSMTDQQKNATVYLIGAALEEAASTANDGAAEHSETDEGAIAHQEGNDDMTRNLFESQQAGATGNAAETHTLSHDDLKDIFEKGRKLGSLKAAVEQYAEAHLEHGISNIDILFPDARNVTGAPELDKRRTEWVSSVLSGTRHTPFSRIKTFAADLTQDQARAKGYIKGNYKLEEWFGVTKRTTTPTTIYKKQKLDRDDMLDITDFDIVAFLKAEMRLMTEEEIARAILIGDGRDVSAEDKIKDPMGASSGDGIRSVLNDHEYYVTTLNVNVDDANSSYEEVVDAVMDGMEYYKGTGTPTFYTTVPELNKFLKARDGMQRRIYANKDEVAQALGVDDIVTVEPMKEIAGLVGIIVNLQDYNVGTDKGGELTMFDDFDIDYNQQKYLLETRLSGALIRPKTALVIKKTGASNVLAVPLKPAFVASTGVVTIPTVTGVVYKAADGTTTLSAGAQTALAAGASTTVYSVPASGYYFADTVNDSWPFTRNPA